MNATIVITEMVQLTEPGMPTTWIGRLKDSQLPGFCEKDTPREVADYFLNDFPIIEQLELDVRPANPDYVQHCRECGTRPWPRNWPPIGESTVTRRNFNRRRVRRANAKARVA
jgi:hypothetical protein